MGQFEPFVDISGNGVHDPTESNADIKGNAQWDADMGATGFGRPAAYVEYKISYDWHVLTPMTAAFMGNNGTQTPSGSLAMRNKPYGP